MIRRVLMLLLLIGLALPAMAAPASHGGAMQHDAAMAMDHMDHHRHPAPVHQAAKHDCIGCIAPYHDRIAVLAPPLPHPLLEQRPVQALPSVRAGPETPPPKS
ncbi:MAG: hypothetical protein JSR28_08135 [Proteobacteria bacterium]|nr:hypothetical protein [Pseudomonadota bacterium]